MPRDELRGDRRDGAEDAAEDAASDRKAVHLLISGRVQGVFYRASTREQGEHLGLAGWVRNRHDGGVEAHVQGAARQVDALVEWCRSGPPTASVDQVVCEPAAYDTTLTRFGIRP